MIERTLYGIRYQVRSPSWFEKRTGSRRLVLAYRNPFWCLGVVDDSGTAGSACTGYDRWRPFATRDLAAQFVAQHFAAAS